MSTSSSSESARTTPSRSSTACSTAWLPAMAPVARARRRARSRPGRCGGARARRHARERAARARRNAAGGGSPHEQRYVSRLRAVEEVLDAEHGLAARRDRVAHQDIVGLGGIGERERHGPALHTSASPGRPARQFGAMSPKVRGPGRRSRRAQGSSALQGRRRSTWPARPAPSGHEHPRRRPRRSHRRARRHRPRRARRSTASAATWHDEDAASMPSGSSSMLRTHGRPSASAREQLTRWSSPAEPNRLMGPIGAPLIDQRRPARSSG